MKRLPPLMVVALLAACGTGKNKPLAVQTETVARRDVIVSADANGAIEPIVIVEVRSKASGMVMNMPVETGTFVNPGDLLVQVDTQTVQKQFEQAAADLNSAKAQYEVAVAQKRRSDDMLAAKVITTQENEQARLTYESARATEVRQRANLDIAQQALLDATVKAVSAGTVIEKDVQVGQIIQSSTNSVGGGTTLLKMADLTHVRMRAFFNETDIGNIRAGEPATVTVDAFPDRRFEGKVEKIEPQAVVQQGVTMFPVLVNLENFDGALRPGMNGEVSAIVDQRTNVIAVSNDALKTTREGATVAPMLGLSPDTVQSQIRAQMNGGLAGAGAGRRSGGAGRRSGRGMQTARSKNGTGGTAVGAPEQTVRARPRAGLVFVADSAGYKPRVVMLGQSNFDYAEVLSGLTDGEKVVLLNVLALQAQRQQMQDRFRQNQASPLGGGRGGGRGF